MDLVVDQETSLDWGLQCSYLGGVQSKRSVFSVKKYRRLPSDPRVRLSSFKMLHQRIGELLYGSCPPWHLFAAKYKGKERWADCEGTSAEGVYIIFWYYENYKGQAASENNLSQKFCSKQLARIHKISLEEDLWKQLVFYWENIIANKCSTL